MRGSDGEAGARKPMRGSLVVCCASPASGPTRMATAKSKVRTTLNAAGCKDLASLQHRRRRMKALNGRSPPWCGERHAQRPGRAARAPGRWSMMLGSRSSFNDPIHPEKQRLRDGQPERLDGPHVDRQLELSRLFYG